MFSEYIPGANKPKKVLFPTITSTSYRPAPEEIILRQLPEDNFP